MLGRKRAGDVDHHYSRAGLSATVAVVGYLLDDPELARSGAEETLTLAAERGFHSVEVMARFTLGWARACLGEVDEGIRDVETGRSLAESTGGGGALPLLYSAAAHVYRMARQWERVGELLELATAECDRTGENSYIAYVDFARARILVERGNAEPAEAERLLLEAVERADAYDYLQLGLMISTHLARLAPQTGNLREAHDRLASHYASLTEGFDRGTAREAKAALDELAVRLDAEPTAS